MIWVRKFWRNQWINLKFRSSPTEFSLLFPRDPSDNNIRNLSLQSPVKIQEQSYILGGDLPELSSNEVESFFACDTIFNFSQLESLEGNSRKTEDNNESSKLSLKSDDIFTGSLSSLERTLFEDAIGHNTTKSCLQDSEKTPDSSMQESITKPIQAAPCKRKQDLSAIRQGQIKFIDGNSRPVTRFATRSCRQLTYQDEYLRLTGIDDESKVSKIVKSSRCPGCSKMFKKLQQHKCKVLTKTVSDPFPAPSLQNHQKYKCKTCKKTFRSEPSFQNHLSSHVEGQKADNLSERK